MTDFIQTDSIGRCLVKGGVKLPYYSNAAYTKEGYVVPLGHAEGIVFAGLVESYEGVDSTNGQDGEFAVSISDRADRSMYVFASDLTEEFNVKIENLKQPVFASSSNALYMMPGAGRLPIGILTGIKKNFTMDPTRDPNEIYYEINTGKTSAVYRP